jgi:hypothetical protein
LNNIILALLLGVGGFFAAALFTFVIGLAGAPGALLTAAVTRGKTGSEVPAWGVLLTALGQFAASLVWIAALYNSVHGWLDNGSGLGRFLVWVVALIIANAPLAVALKDAAREPNKNVQHVATTIASPLTLIASLVLLFVPSLLEKGFGWVPHFGNGASSNQAQTSLPPEYVSHRDSLSSAFQAFSTVTRLTQVPAGQTSMASTPEHDLKVKRALEQGLRAGRSVGRDFLNWLHPQMQEHFEGRYLAGQALYLEGLQEQNPAKQIRGNELIAEWYSQFWEAHSKMVVAKAFPE